jgi:hypothetical protein
MELRKVPRGAHQDFWYFGIYMGSNTFISNVSLLVYSIR